MHEDIVEAVDDDGCCADAMTAQDDADCRPTCGNHIVEVGELCDPCPLNCDDADACTRDSLHTGNDACNIWCAHDALPASARADHCCPDGADPRLDPDCARCGNGVVEAGEQCDGGDLCTLECRSPILASAIHRYQFDGMGSTIVDSVGNASGELLGGELDGSGVLDLQGGTSNQYVALPAGLISGLTAVTIEAWLRWDGGSPRQRIFDFGMNTGNPGAVRTGQGTSYFYVTPNGDDDRVGAYMNFSATADDNDNDVVASGREALSTDGVHQIVASFGDGNLRLYVDARLRGERHNITGTLDQIDDRNTWIGRANYPEDELNGALYEFRIYDRALTDAEIEASFRAGAER